MNYITENNEKLIDVNSRNKDRNWTNRKRKSSVMSDIMLLASQQNEDLLRRSNVMKSCCDYLIFQECEVNSEHKHLEHALFCRDRFCPICNWRRSLVLFQRNVSLYTELQQRYNNAKHYMLTLTVQNCLVEDLKDTIKLINKSWDRFSRRKIIKKNFNLGYLKVLEITRNNQNWSNWYKTMHPHLHCIMSTTDQNINTEAIEEQIKTEWLESLQIADVELYKHYQEYLQVEIHEIKDITKADYDKNTTSHNINLNALAEVSKYTMKFNSLFCKEETKQEKATFLAVLSEQLKGVRNLSFGGEVAKIARELNIDKEETNEDLLSNNDDTAKIEGICAICGGKTNQVTYQYNRKNRDNTYRKVTEPKAVEKYIEIPKLQKEYSDYRKEVKLATKNRNQELETLITKHIKDRCKYIGNAEPIEELRAKQLSFFEKGVAK